MSWLEKLFRNRKLEAQLDSELRFHLEQRTADLIAAGVAPAEACRRAMLEFGGVEGVKEECRESRSTYFLESILQDVRYALRTLRKSPGFALTAVLTLALGIGANTAIFSVVEAVLLRPLPYAHPSQLVNVWTRFGKLYAPSSLPDLEVIRKEIGSLKELAVWTYGQVTLTGHGAPEEIPAARLSADFFPLLGVEPFYGRTFVPADFQPDNGHEVILSAGFWKKWFGGDPHAIGRGILLNHATYTIVGIMPWRFNLPSRTELWMPFVPTPAETANREDRLHYDVGRLSPSSSVPQLQTELNIVAARLARTFPNADSGVGFTVRPLKFYFVGGTQTPLFVLFGAVGLVLLIACANVGNLYLARGWSRIHELAIRAALGASRQRLIRQFLIEASVLALAGGAIGLLLAVWAMAGLRSLTVLHTPLLQNANIDARVLWFTFVVAVLAGIAFGLAPAFVISRDRLTAAMRETGGGHGVSSASPRQSQLRQLLVVGEVALALVLVVCAGLALRSFARLSAVPLGFRANHVLTMQLDLPSYRFKTAPEYVAYANQILEKVRATPGVESASISNDIPLGNRRGGIFFRIEGRPLSTNSERRLAIYNGVAPGYFQTLGIPILAGRDFNASDLAGSERVVIVDRAFARRYFGNESPIGQHISGHSDKNGHPVWDEIVGEVGNVRDVSPSEKHTPFIYGSYAQQGLAAWGTPPEMDLAVRTGAEPVALAQTIKDRIWSTDKDQPITHLAALSQVVSTTYAEPRSQSILLGLFGGLGLMLALVGIYGVISYFVGQRTREIGIRVALGAQSGGVLRLVLRQGAVLVFAGVAVGLGSSFAATRLMRGLLYGVTATDPLTFAGVSILLVLAGLAACYIPARRAARVDPVVALRQE